MCFYDHRKYQDHVMITVNCSETLHMKLMDTVFSYISGIRETKQHSEDSRSDFSFRVCNQERMRM